MKIALLVAGLLGAAFHCHAQASSQGFILYAYSVDADRYLHIQNGIPQSQIGLSSKQYGGKQVAVATVNSLGEALLTIPVTEVPAFAVSKKSYTDNTQMGNGKVVFFEGDEFGIKDLQLKEEKGSVSISWSAVTGNMGSIRYNVLASKDNTNFIPISTNIGIPGSEHLYTIADNKKEYKSYKLQVVNTAAGIRYISPLLRTANSSINLYPTVSSGNITVEALSAGMPVFYRIMDVAGKMVADGILSSQSTVDVSSLVPGMYIMHIVNGAETVQAKFIRQ